MKKWFSFKAKTEDPSVAEIHIVDFIGDWIDDYWGFGVTAKAFLDQLSKLPQAVKTIKVHINSPGGDVFSALNIANALRDQRATKGRAVETIVDGLAASAASVVLMAGDPIRIADNGIVMIHNPWSVAVGDAREMEKVKEVLDGLRDAIVATYRWHSEKDPEDLIALMDAETWLGADEAIEAGLADEKVEGLRAAAAITPKLLDRLTVPEAYAERVKAFLAAQEEEEDDEEEDEDEAEAKAQDEDDEDEEQSTTDAVLAACEAAGLDLAFARALAAKRLSVAKVEAAVNAEKAKRVAAAKREADIRALCAKAGHDDLAPSLVASGWTFDQAKAHVALLVAKLDKVEIDSGLTPDHGTGRKPVIDTVAVYRDLNRLPAAAKN